MHAVRRAFGEITFKLDYLHKEGLPGALSSLDSVLNLLAPLGVLGLHKFLPCRRWFQHELAPTIMERISTDRVRQAPWWASGVPEALARAHFAGRANYVRELNAVLTVEAIDRLFLSVQERRDKPLIGPEVSSEGLTTAELNARSSRESDVRRALRSEASARPVLESQPPGR